MLTFLLLTLLLNGCGKKPPDNTPEILIGNDKSQITTDLETCWRTYWNPQFQFKFSYPPNWGISNESTSETHAIFSLDIGANGVKGDFVAWFDILSTDNIDKAIGNFKKGVSNNPKFSEKEIIIDNQAGKNIFLLPTKDDDQGQRWFFIPHNSKIYRIGITHDVAPYSKEFDQIISTFKFLDDKPTVTMDVKNKNLYERIKIDGQEYATIKKLDEEIIKELKINCGDFNSDGIKEVAIDIPSGGEEKNLGVLIYKIVDEKTTLIQKISGTNIISTIENNKLTISLPIYNQGDKKCCPTAGYGVTEYNWNGKQFIAGKTKQYFFSQ